MTGVDTARFGLRDGLAALFRYRRMLAAVLLAAMLLALAGTFMQSPTYIAKSRVLVQQTRLHTPVAGALTAAGMQPMPRQDQIRTEVQIFLSPEVIEEAARRLGPEDVNQRMRRRMDWLGEALQRARFWNRQGPPNPLAQSGRKLLDHLAVEPVREADVFEISLEAPDARFAERAVDKLVEVYEERHIALRQGPASSGPLDAETERQRRELEQAVVAAGEYKRRTGLIDPAAQKALLLQRISETEAQLGRLDLEAADARNRVASLEGQLADITKSRTLQSTAIRNPSLEPLQAKLSELESERRQFVEGSPLAAQVDRELAAVRARMKSQAALVSGPQVTGQSQAGQETLKLLAMEKSRLHGLESRGRLQQQLAGYRSELALTDRNEVQLQQLTRVASLKEEAFRSSLRKAEEARLNSALDRGRIANVAPIEAARADDMPVRPRRLLNVLLGALVGLLGGLGLAYLSEYFRRSFANREELERALGKPVLASILDSDGSRRVTATNAVELRRIGEALIRARKQGDAGAILVMSALPREGRTYMVERLARTLLRQGCSVMVLRAGAEDAEAVPSHAEHDPPAARGRLAARAAAPALDAVKAIAAPQIATGSVIPAEVGYIAWSTRLEGEIEAARRRVDFVLVDTPPLSSEPECAMLARAADGVIMVVEADRTAGVTLARAIRSIESSGGTVLGLVLNRWRYLIPDWAYSLFISPREVFKHG